ncbi:MAG: hypothetical protein KKD99_07655 [Proteobacteria bacterium]|nr:hypothetical protein [Pseudomonadota bacterium]MBU4357088.1 hypothetical protein [Pseudomonadota bacterium]MBU4448445.1 hypothetical protein [Pseudomonadota bacterium]MCG2773213.1 hypothetical protein [Desulfobacterales bacterium]
MSVKVITRKINARKITIKMVDGSLIEGKINIYHGEEVVQRVSDIFTKVRDPFIVVFDVTAEGKSGGVLIINKRNISWVSPEDEPVRKEPQEDEEPEEPAKPKGSWMERMRSS